MSSQPQRLSKLIPTNPASQRIVGRQRRPVRLFTCSPESRKSTPRLHRIRNWQIRRSKSTVQLQLSGGTSQVGCQSIQKWLCHQAHRNFGVVSYTSAIRYPNYPTCQGCNRSSFLICVLDNGFRIKNLRVRGPMSVGEEKVQLPRTLHARVLVGATRRNRSSQSVAGKRRSRTKLFWTPFVNTTYTPSVQTLSVEPLENTMLKPKSWWFI
jgi:hypothetical protein